MARTAKPLIAQGLKKDIDLAHTLILVSIAGKKAFSLGCLPKMLGPNSTALLRKVLFHLWHTENSIMGLSSILQILNSKKITLEIGENHLTLSELRIKIIRMQPFRRIFRTSQRPKKIL